MYPKAKFDVHVDAIPGRSSVDLSVVCFRGHGKEREERGRAAAPAEEERRIRLHERKGKEERRRSSGVRGWRTVHGTKVGRVGGGKR